MYIRMILHCIRQGSGKIKYMWDAYPSTSTRKYYLVVFSYTTEDVTRKYLGG